jgi:hypothetical protein
MVTGAEKTPMQHKDNVSGAPFIRKTSKENKVTTRPIAFALKPLEQNFRKEIKSRVSSSSISTATTRRHARPTMSEIRV